MLMPQPLNRKMKLISLHEYESYTEETIKTKIHALGEDIDEDSVLKILEILRQRKSNPYDEKTFKFEFIGICPIRMSVENELIENILLVIYPKWKKIDENPKWSTWFFNHYFFSSLVSYQRVRGKKTMMSDELGASLTFFGTKTAHILDCMLLFISDVNRFGIFHDQQHIENLRKGKTNWKKTFQKGKIIISGNTPYYLQPIRTKKSKLHNELSQIHQEMFSHSMTIVSQYLPSITAKVSWRELMTISQIERKINVVKNALKTAKLQKQRDRLNHLLLLLEAKAVYSENSEEIIGISSLGFNGLWEHALLRVIGDEYKTNKINDLILSEYSVKYKPNEKDAEWKFSSDSRHIIDGLAIAPDGKLVIFDAKNYSSWKSLAIGDIVKQYSYKNLIDFISKDINEGESKKWKNQSLNSLDFEYLRDNEIKSNVFIFPLNSLSLNQDDNEEIRYLGKYRIEYLRDKDDEDLFAVAVNPVTLLKEYKEGGGGLHRRFIEVVTDSAVDE